MKLRSTMKTLLVLVLGLPLAQAVLVGVRGLLDSMGDADGGELIGLVRSLCLGTWAICLVALVIVVSLVVLDDQGGENEDE